MVSGYPSTYTVLGESYTSAEDVCTTEGENIVFKELEELKGTYYKLMELQRKALALKGIE